MEAWLGVLVSMAETLQLCVAVSDMAAPGAPMVYVNGEFCRMTGYAFDECVGRNCRFLQGPETETEAVEILRESLAAGRDVIVISKGALMKLSGATAAALPTIDLLQHNPLRHLIHTWRVACSGQPQAYCTVVLFHGGGSYRQDTVACPATRSGAPWF